MTKPQALALMNALEGAKVAASAVLSFDVSGAPSWTVQLAPTVVYSGAQLAALTSYCATNNLLLSAQVAELGVT